MSITLTPEQQEVIERAIQSGLVRLVDYFINSAIGVLSRHANGFDKEKAQCWGERICELRKGVTFDLRGTSIRELAPS